MYILKLLNIYLVIQIAKCDLKTSADGTWPDSDVQPEQEHGRWKRDARDHIGSYCGKTFNMMKKKKITFTIFPGNYFPKVLCSISFLGTSKCIPELYCPVFDLGTEVNDRLVVTDALGGKLIVAGKSKTLAIPRKSSGGGRDLFIRLLIVTEKKLNNNMNLSCTVSCSPSLGAKAAPLPSNGIVKQEEYNCVCGMQNDEQRVVGGQDTKQNEFPWQVAIVYPNTRQAFCGGSIINNQYILTATHCFWFTEMKESDIEVLLHAHVLDFTVVIPHANTSIPLGKHGSMQSPGYKLSQRTDADEHSQRFKVTKLIMHPLFAENFDYDVALLRLDRKINFVGDDTPNPICLPDIKNLGTTYDKEIVTVSGWGLAHELAGASTRLLQKLKVPVIPFADCHRVLPNQISERMLCAGYLGGVQDACTGDSGGPLVLRPNNKKQTTQIGIVSWGEGCARKNKPGVYSRVTEFLQWIYHHANTRYVAWCRTDAMDSRAANSANSVNTKP